MSSGYSASPATGIGSSCAWLCTTASTARTSIAPVGRFGLTASDARAVTLPVMVTTDSLRRLSITAKAGPSTSVTIWVMPK